MASKLYLHAATTTVAGTLPAAGVSVSATTPTKIASGVNRTLSRAIGVAQTSQASTTNAVVTAQPSLMARWISPPVSAQTFASQAIGFHIGGSESNASSNFQIRSVVALWRPSTNTKIGLLTDLATTASLEPGTTQTALNGTTASSTSQVAIDGDVLIVELWRDSTVQAASTAFTNTIFYDGTTEDSTTTNAGYVNFANTITFLGDGYGQAQADIKATSHGFGQSQATIEAPIISVSGLTYRSSTSVFDATGSAVAPPIPPGTAVGDLLIAHIAWRTNGTVSDGVGGWTAKGQISGGTTRTLAIFYKIATSADISRGSFLFNCTGSSNALATIHAFSSGFNESFPVDAGNISSNAAGTFTSGSVTPTEPNEVMMILAMAQSSTAAPFSGYNIAVRDSGNWAEVIDVGDNTVNISLAAAYSDPRLSQTATGNGSLTFTASVANIVALISIRTPSFGIAQAQAFVYGTKLYLTDDTSDVIVAGEVSKSISFTQRSAAVSKTTNTVVGPTTGVQVTNGAGGTPITWYSDPLRGGQSIGPGTTLLSHIWGLLSVDTANVGLQFRLFQVDQFGNYINDVRNSEFGTELGTASALQAWTFVPNFIVHGINHGDRLAVQILGNDAGGTMAAGTFTITYGAAIGVSGDSYGAVAEVLLKGSNGFGQAQAQISLAGGTGFGQAQAFIAGPIVLHVCGAECRLVDSASMGSSESQHYTGITGTAPTVETTNIDSAGGTAAFNFTTAGSPVASSLNKTLLYNGLSTQKIVGRFAFRLSNLPSSGSVTVARAVNSQGNFDFLVDSTGAAFMKIGSAAAVQIGSYSVTTSVYHRFDFVIDASTGTASFKVSINDTNETTTTRAQSASTVTSWQIGPLASPTASTTYLYDNILITGFNTSNYPLGAGKVLSFVPTAVGTHSFTLGEFRDETDASLSPSETTSWSKLTDVPDDASTSYVYTFSPASSASYAEYVYAQTTEKNNPRAVVQMASTGYGLECCDYWVRFQLNDGTISTDAFDPLHLFNISGTGFAVRQRIWQGTPSSSTWTISNFNNLRIRFGYYNSNHRTGITNTVIEAEFPIIIPRAFGQAQADIKAKSNGFAQARADIKATSFGFGQAQTDIKATSFGFAQAQSDIKATSFGFAQSQADIKATSNGFGQSQADIKATSYGFGQAQVDTKAIGRGFAQAQADIKAVGNGLAQAQAKINAFGVNAFGQAQADIKSTSYGEGQSQADIKSVSYGLGQSNADILVTTFVEAQAQADIKATGYGEGQAQADIKVTSFVEAQAQADIKQTSFVEGQAQADIKQTYTQPAQAQADIKVTSFVEAQAQADIKQTYVVSAQANADIHATSFVEAQAQSDIKQTYTQSAQAQADILQTYFGVAQAQADILHTYVGNAQAQADILQTYYGLAQTQADIRSINYSESQAQADIKATFFGEGQANARILATSYSEGQANADIRTTYYQNAQSQADILVSNYVEAQAQANISQTSFGLAQAQASIKATNYGEGQAQAKLNAFGVNQCAQAQANVAGQTYPTGQAQAKINAFGVNAFGQSQADIKAVGYGEGQAQADVKATEFVWAQAQSDIKVTGFAEGQAQADVKATSFVAAQSQADIKDTSFVEGQSQADIKATSFGEGQAQTDIKQTSFSEAQAQANIVAVRYGESQAAADILATSNKEAQAQADIKSTSFVEAQAQADIKITSFADAQAQANISHTSFVEAQAQSSIKAVSSSLGQANADIFATSYHSAQAQADIKFTTQQYAQSQVYIKARIAVCGQAQADIKVVTSRTGQAQADIQQTYNGVANAQTDIRATINNYGQSNASIISATDVFGQAQAYILNGIDVCGQAQAQILASSLGFGQAQAFILKSAGYGQARARVIVAHTLKTVIGSDRASLLLSGSDRAIVVASPADKAMKILGADKPSLVVNASDRSVISILGKDEAY